MGETTIATTNSKMEPHPTIMLAYYLLALSLIC